MKVLHGKFYDINDDCGISCLNVQISFIINVREDSIDSIIDLLSWYVNHYLKLRRQKSWDIITIPHETTSPSNATYMYPDIHKYMASEAKSYNYVFDVKMVLSQTEKRIEYKFIGIWWFGHCWVPKLFIHTHSP